MRHLLLILVCAALLPAALWRERKERRAAARRQECIDATLEMVRLQREKNARFLRELFQGEKVLGAPRVKVLESGIVTVRASCPEEAATIVSVSDAFKVRSA